ncbi:hypothetical protein SLEP1_g41048 [Rubroshorea leprosula]|uniref:Uncharacterized protein n=1 Tax=Rubroshorea leprosula TaxID=152421 RepID=A0AAV5L668_9ROSI|nr:hypothetical protein SLEP1_g41048 [Rubroshorea leprosula]
MVNFCGSNKVAKLRTVPNLQNSPLLSCPFCRLVHSRVLHFLLSKSDSFLCLKGLQNVASSGLNKCGLSLQILAISPHGKDRPNPTIMELYQILERNGDATQFNSEAFLINGQPGDLYPCSKSGETLYLLVRLGVVAHGVVAMHQVHEKA